MIVKIGGAGLCRTDIHLYLGQWHELDADAPLPYTLGHENAGWVHEVGSAVGHVAPGDTVILHPQPTCGFCLTCRAGDDMHCVDSFFPGLNTHGGMATFLKHRGRAVVKIDPKLQPADVAALADAGLTAYHAVRKAVPLLYPGTACVVIGAGGLGHIAIQVLKALCATTIIVVDRNPEALEFAKGIGADHGVVADGGHVDKVKELTGGYGAEVVLDFVGEMGAEKDAWQMTRRAGSHYIIGYGGTVEVPTIELISTERNVIGNLVGTYNDLAELMALAAQGKVTLHTKTYPWRPPTTPSTTSTTAGCPAPARSSSRAKGGAHVREGRREVLRGRRPHALLGRERGEHQEQVRRGLHPLLLRLPQEPEPRGLRLVAGEVPQVRRGHPDEGPLRGRLRRRGHLPADLPDRLLPRGVQHHRAGRGPQGEVPGQVRPQHLLRAAPWGGRPGPVRGEGPQVRLQGREAVHGRVARRLQGLEVTDPWALRHLEKCQELGVKNIHVHKGPTIWPLNRDSFDLADVDDAASTFPELNFIVEHVGLPRLEDMC